MTRVKAQFSNRQNEPVGTEELPEAVIQPLASTDHRLVFAQFAATLERALLQINLMASQASGPFPDQGSAPRNQKAHAHARQVR